MTSNKRETVTELTNLKSVGTLEIKDPKNSEEYHIFDIAHNDKYVVVGTIANVGLLPDFWIEKDETFSLDEHLQTINEMIEQALIDDELDELNGLIEL